MHTRLKPEAATFFRLFDGPTREHLGNFGDVFLRVSAVDAESVKLHQLAAIVFVQAACHLSFSVERPILNTPIAAFLVASGRDSQSNVRAGTYAQPVVEVKQHRGTLRGCDQEVFEFSERVRTYCVTLIARDENAVIALV